MNKNSQIIWRKIDDLIPYDYNTKEHTPEQIEKLRLSFERYGWQNAVMVDTDDVIIYGHGRCLGAKAAGLTEAPTIVCDDLTDEQIREYRIADNMLQDGGYIETALMHELPLVDLEEFEFDFGLMQYYDEDYGTDFSLPNEDAPQFRTMTLTFNESQYRTMQAVIDYITENQLEEQGGNEKSNAVFFAVKEWAKQKNLL